MFLCRCLLQFLIPFTGVKVARDTIPRNIQCLKTSPINIKKKKGKRFQIKQFDFHEYKLEAKSLELKKRIN